MPKTKKNTVLVAIVVACQVMVKKTVPQLGISHIDGLTFLLLTNITDAGFVQGQAVKKRTNDHRLKINSFFNLSAIC